MSLRWFAPAFGLVTVIAAPGAGQETPRSVPITDVSYEVTFDSTTAPSRLLAVRMSFRTTGADPVILSLPAWTPGAYEMSYFARNVEDFTATAGGRPARWDKLDYDTWRIESGAAQAVTVSFNYVADTLDNAMAWSRPDFALFNGTNVFMYPEGRPLEFPSRVTIHTQAGWRVVTGMTPGDGEHAYRAANFHDLVDMPTFVGRVELDSQQIAGKWYRLATYPVGTMRGAARTQFWNEMHGLMPPLIAPTGETPWNVYSVMMIFDPSFPGASALEHQNSHVGVYTPLILGNPLLASITAHEIFHAWNVKRLRPQAMWPYEYSHPQPTELLWISEGITDYYADLALVRGGVIVPPQFYNVTAGKVDEVARAPATALEDASLSTWIHPVDGSQDLYYPKGSLAGFLLDIMIRDASDNRTSLDDVFRDLWTRDYKAGKGFSNDDWWQAVSRAAGGRSFDEFYRRYVDGRDPFPYATVLPLAGLALHADTTRVPRLGINTVRDSAGVHVRSVTLGGAADQAGVQEGDQLVRVGETPVTDNNFGDAFRSAYQQQPAGTPIDLVVRRGEQTLTLRAALAFAAVVDYAISADPAASAKARSIREGILSGETAR